MMQIFADMKGIAFSDSVANVHCPGHCQRPARSLNLLSLCNTGEAGGP